MSSDIHALGFAVLDAMDAENEAAMAELVALREFLQTLSELPLSKEVREALERFCSARTKAERAEKSLVFRVAVEGFVDAAREAERRPHTHMDVSIAVDPSL